MAAIREGGRRGLSAPGCGRARGRRKEAKLRQRVWARYAEQSPDFGPTLAAEKLVEAGMVVDHETLRRWLSKEGLWQPGRKRPRHRAWWERKASFGQMVRELRDGGLQWLYEGQKLRVEGLPERPARAKPEPRRVGRTRLTKPAKEHPWRKRGAATGQSFWRREKARGAQVKEARHHPAAAFGQPSLRSA